MLKLFNAIGKKYKFLSFISIFLTFLQVLTDLIVPSMLVPIVNIIANQSVPPGIPIEYKITFFYDKWFIVVNSAEQALTITSSVMLSAAILGMAFGLLSSWIASVVAVEVARIARRNMFNNIQKYSASNFSKYGTSSLMTRITNDVAQVQNASILMLRLLVRAPLLFIGGLTFSLLANLKLSISFAFMIPVMLLIIGLTGMFAMPLFKKNQKIMDAINNESRENILGVRVIKSFNLEKFQENKFDKINNSWFEVSNKAITIMNILIPSVIFVTNLSMVIICIIAKTFDNSNNLSLASELTVFAQYLGYVTSGLIMTVMVLVMLFRSRVSSNRINELLNEKADIKNIESNVKIESPNIEFNNVFFKYHDEGEYAISDITFKIKQGQTLGIIGSTGSGKSTIVNLLSRIYLPTSGTIKIDNKNINTIDSIHLNESISQVLQESVLYSGTIKSNLLFGKLDATEEQIDNALTIACAKPFVDSFEKKLDHVVEQRGKNLSGGQKQRLQIARGIIREPKILVLDDSTSALDVITEKNLKNNIKKYLNKTTVIIVAQKISSIKDADKIIVLDKGKMVGYGNHNELMKNCALYKEIEKTQIGGKK